MGVFKRQSEAFELMKELRQQGLKVAIKENDDGKWAVQVSRKNCSRKMQRKGGVNEEDLNWMPIGFNDTIFGRSQLFGKD